MNSPGASTNSCSTLPSLTTIEKALAALADARTRQVELKPDGLGKEAIAVAQHGDVG